MLYQLKYQNDLGQTIVFGGISYAFVDTHTSHISSSSYRLNKFEGFGDVGADVQRQKSPYQDGSTHIDTILEERPLFIEFTLVADNFIELSAMRRNISKVFNPKIKGNLELSYGGNTYLIGCSPEHVPVFADGGTDSVGNTQVGVIDLIAPNPYWESPNPTNIKLEDFVSSFRFPFRFPVRFATRGDRRVLINNGDAPTPITVTFVGNAINPVIKNETTGEFIKINREIPAGFKMVVITEFGRQSVEIIDSTGHATDVFKYIDPNSSFFSLAIGENEISFIAEGGRPDVYIEYKERFVAV